MHKVASLVAQNQSQSPAKMTRNSMQECTSERTNAQKFEHVDRQVLSLKKKLQPVGGVTRPQTPPDGLSHAAVNNFDGCEEVPPNSSRDDLGIQNQ